MRLKHRIPCTRSILLKPALHPRPKPVLPACFMLRATRISCVCSRRPRTWHIHHALCNAHITCMRFAMPMLHACIMQYPSNAHPCIMLRISCTHALCNARITRLHHATPVSRACVVQPPYYTHAPCSLVSIPVLADIIKVKTFVLPTGNQEISRASFIQTPFLPSQTQFW